MHKSSSLNIVRNVSDMPKPIVAIVGRPNVGKSMLFNRIIGERRSIVHDMPGVTRDRLYAGAEWNGVEFLLVDTGGIEPNADTEILKKMRAQAELAIETADCILFLTDLRDGVTAADSDVLIMLKKSQKPLVLAVNKVDTPGSPPGEFYEFFNLGIEPIPCSAIHGMGVGDVLDAVVTNISSVTQESEEDDTLKVAIIGKPNVGKSSLVNRILKQERVIVSDAAGTTRDTVDAFYTHNGENYVLIDTAGIRRRNKINEKLEHFTVVRALAAVERADVALIMLDANVDISEQDTKIAGYAHECGKASVLAVNKWDSIEKDDKTTTEYKNAINNKLAFMTYAPIVFISAKTGQRVDKLFDMINYAANQNAMRVSTGLLNDVVNDAMARMQPPSDKGKRLKIYYITQASTKPPTFVLFVNDKQLAHFSYVRYIENQIRQSFGIIGTPIRMLIRERKK